MTCKYPITSRSYKFCLGCSDIDCCEDAVTSNIPMPEVQPPKNVIPSASEANKMTNNAIDSYTTQQLAELSKLIRDAIADGKFSISEDGCLKPETRKKLEELGYKLKLVLSTMNHITVLVGEKRNEVLHIGNLVEEMKKYDDVDEQTLWWINKALSYSGYPSHVGKQKIKEHIKEIETMENNKVRQFIDLLVNEEETIENAAKVSGIGDMKLVDVLKTISEMEFESIKAFSSAVAGMNSMKEAIHTVKDLDDALVELKKSSEK